MDNKIPKRMTTAILQSLGAGVVPRVGLEYIAVGRKEEISALLNDLDQVVVEGGATFRLILGRYGSGKSFLCQTIRDYALKRNFVVADADMSPERRLTGTDGQGLGLYRELMNNMATRTRPDGNAFSALLERWMSDVQSEVMHEGLDPTTDGFMSAVETRIHTVISQMEGMVHGFDFANVLIAYWRGYQTGNDDLKNAALRWLRGEYTLKSEARDALGVRVIIDDASWYDYIKLMAHFVKDIGYKGLVIFLDEAVNLYKISNSVSRRNNYERLLSIYNDALQGKAQYLGIVIGVTPQMVEDTQRGLFSYEALRTRLEESRFAKEGLRDLSGSMIRLNVLTQTEIFVLLQRLREVHGMHYGYDSAVSDDQIQKFMKEVMKRLGADQLLTPREIIRDFIAILNLLQQNPTLAFNKLITGSDFQPTKSTTDPEELRQDTEIHDSTPSSFSNFQI